MSYTSDFSEYDPTRVVDRARRLQADGPAAAIAVTATANGALERLVARTSVFKSAIKRLCN